MVRGLAAIGFALLLMCAVPIGRAQANDACTATLWAGQHSSVGTVSVWKGGGYLFATYRTIGGWELEEIHLAIAGSVKDIPRNRGGPIPGRFHYKKVVDGNYHIVRFPCDAFPKGDLFIAAHAVVTHDGSDPQDCTADLMLPSGVVQACFEFPGQTSFADITLSNAGAYDGEYEGWCIDMERGLGGCTEDVTMVGSYSPEAQGTVDRPENLDVLNYILNQDYSSWGAGRDEIQAALWGVIDDDDWTLGGGILPDVGLAQAIIDDAMANGDGYVPGPGEFVAVILYPLQELQTTVIKVPVPDCPPSGGGTETAWAGEREFPGKNWARYLVCSF